MVSTDVLAVPDAIQFTLIFLESLKICIQVQFVFNTDCTFFRGRSTRGFGGSVADSNLRRRRRDVDPLLR